MKIFNIKIPKEIISILIIIIIAFIINIIIKKLVKKVIKIDTSKNTKTNNRRKTIMLLIQKIISIVIIIIAGISILGVYNINTTALITSVGAMSIVVGLALQDILKDFLVGLSIIIEDSFSIGDTIEINGFRGEVVDFSLKSTRIKSVKNETFIIANRLINEIINYSINKKTLMIDINTRYEEDVDKVRKVLDDLCIEIPKKIKEIETIKLEDGIQNLAESSVVYRLSMPVNIKDIYVTKRKVLEEVKRAFDKNDISIPYNQLEVHNYEQ